MDEKKGEYEKVWEKYILSRVRVTYKTGIWIGFIDTLYT
jgi:hypothetical protein